MNINQFLKFRYKIKLYQILYVAFIIVFITFIGCYMYYLKVLKII